MAQQILNQKNKMAAKNFFLKQEKYTQPIFSISSYILGAAGLIERGTEPKMMSILLPSLIVNFLPPLIANCAFQRYSISTEGVVMYFIGTILGLYIHSNKIILDVLSYTPLISKCFGYLQMIHSKESTKDLITWLVINEIVGMFIRKSFLRKKIRVRTTEAANMLFCLGGLYAVRAYNLPEHTIIAAVCTVPFTKQIRKFISTGKTEKVKIRAATVAAPSASQVSIHSRPRRKAAVAAMTKEE